MELWSSWLHARHWQLSTAANFTASLSAPLASDRLREPCSCLDIQSDTDAVWLINIRLRRAQLVVPEVTPAAQTGCK